MHAIASLHIRERDMMRSAERNILSGGELPRTGKRIARILNLISEIIMSFSSPEFMTER